MRQYGRLCAAVLVLFVVQIGVGGSACGAARHPAEACQPPDEVVALRARVSELERELEAARLRIAELEAQLAAAGVGTAAPAGAAARADAGQEVLSPEHALDRIKEEYAAAFPGPAPGDDRGLRQHLRVLNQWANKINREHRQRVEWTCEIVSRDLIDADEAFVDLVAVDPQSGESIGSRFVIEWPRRMRPVLDRFDDGSRVRLRGMLVPEVRSNESRAEPGAFDIPPLVGPYVEFRFRLQLTAVSEVERDPLEDDPPASRRELER